MTSDDSFLSRWSRRKLTPAKPEAEPVEAEPQEASAAPEPEVEKTDEEILEELGLPDPETLNEGDDFSGFMSGAVPERLRNRALRKLWLTNPVLANLDELVDYGEDFTDAATVIENLQTIYRVGQGMIDRSAPEDDEAAEEVAESSEDAAAQHIDVAMQNNDQEPPAIEDESAGRPETDPDSGRITEGLAAEIPLESPAPRRMKFRFEEG
ncbi:DUF3306 domain-containing protein [Rhodobacteraceae bacterium NNCM2]|nr:DUF3306 domain-containing protein [Coraliihabitans acroporae]